ncbi:MAG: hypothetical protein EP330_00710 [Deltaproteobacteria bacterium]|nr:MAG: hypothetical protein EP330_00710 [Deltaproteobacteria bacterium]
MRAAAALAVDEEMVVQRGASRVEVPGAATYESLGAERLAAAYARARVVIGQASPGVLFDALDAGKQPILVPRMSGLGEHVDDHQLHFARFVADRAVIVEDIETLPELVRTWDEAAHRVDGPGIDLDVVRRIGAEVEAVASSRRARLRRLLHGFFER